MSAPPPAAPPVPGLHVVEVVHAARRLDEQGGVGSAVAVAVAPDSTVVGEGAGGLAVESVAVAGMPDGGPSTGSWSKTGQVRETNFTYNKLVFTAASLVICFPDADLHAS